MLVHEMLDQPLTRRLEGSFYQQYTWCLNPLLKFTDLFQRLSEEFERWKSLSAEWQRNESIINMYLFICAITCIVDDYLARRRLLLAPLKKKFLRWSWLLTALEHCVNKPSSWVWWFHDRTVLQWRAQWTPCIEEVCKLLVNHGAGAESGVEDLRSNVRRLSAYSFPDALRERRMRVVEGYRCQDLTHHDVLSMVDRFASAIRSKEHPVAIVSPRTAGAYFAPLAFAYLQKLGWKNVSWVTVRPKIGLCPGERKILRGMVKRKPAFLVLDDYPNTGSTIDHVVKVLQSVKVRKGQITAVVPVHPVRSNKPSESIHVPGINILRLTPGEIYKEWLLKPQAAQALMGEYFHQASHRGVEIVDDPEVAAMNENLWGHYGDGFHVRLKRVYSVRITRSDGTTETRRVFAKSVGWGWLGYHSYIAGKRLVDFVPKIIGLRDGILYTEWINGSVREVPENADQTLAGYIAARVSHLQLNEEPALSGPEYGWGWLEARSILRKAFGSYTGYLKHGALMQELKRCIQSKPTLIDGRMRPEEWINASLGPVKVDFEHHNFGAPQLDLADPAFDIAASVFEFGLSAQLEERLVNRYELLTQDTTVRSRLLLQKLIYGSVARRLAMEALREQGHKDRCAASNERMLAAHDFLVFSLNRFCADLIKTSAPSRWSDSLFFLDLDGVFDSEVLGFPHATISGLRALEVLQSNGASVILNTGRSIGHVRQYCATYSLPGGIAEYGSVFFDNIGQTEIPLADNGVSEQLKHCHNRITNLPGVLVDPTYRYALRAYRVDGKGTVGLSPDEVERLLRRYRYDNLTAVYRASDTYIVGKHVDKGTAIQAVKQHIGTNVRMTSAMGDSREDIPMLKEVTTAYAPANCSEDVRRWSRKGNCRIMKYPFQRGFLSAVLQANPGMKRTNNLHKTGDFPQKDFRNLMVRLLSVAESTRSHRVARILHRRSI